MVVLTSLIPIKFRVVGTGSKKEFNELDRTTWGSHLATLYRVHDGTRTVASFQVLKDAMEYMALHESYKLVTVNYYQNGIEQMPAHY